MPTIPLQSSHTQLFQTYFAIFPTYSNAASQPLYQLFYFYTNVFHTHCICPITDSRSYQLTPYLININLIEKKSALLKKRNFFLWRWQIKIAPFGLVWQIINCLFDVRWIDYLKISNIFWDKDDIYTYCTWTERPMLLTWA